MPNENYLFNQIDIKFRFKKNPMHKFIYFLK